MRSHVSVELSVAASCFVSVLDTYIHTVQERRVRRADSFCIENGVTLGFDESKSGKTRKVSHCMHLSPWHLVFGEGSIDRSPRSLAGSACWCICDWGSHGVLGMGLGLVCFVFLLFTRQARAARECAYLVCSGPDLPGMDLFFFLRES